MENFVRKLNFILNAIKILRKVITWRVLGFGFSLKDLPGSPGEWIGRREIQKQGRRCRNPGEMITAWAEGMAVAQERGQDLGLLR